MYTYMQFCAVYKKPPVYNLQSIHAKPKYLHIPTTSTAYGISIKHQVPNNIYNHSLWSICAYLNIRSIVECILVYYIYSSIYTDGNFTAQIILNDAFCLNCIRQVVLLVEITIYV
jgi:hypothetical protein